MQMAFEAPAHLNAGATANPADARLHVRFYTGREKDEKASADAGRPVFRDVPFIQIAVPGDRDTVDRIVWDDPSNPHSDTARFPMKWAQYKAGQSEESTGTPLAEWPGITRSQAEELAYFKVRTVEQLASVTDGNLQRMGGGYLSLRTKAQDYLAAAEKAAPVTQMRAELQSRDSKISALEAQLAEMAEAMKAAKKK